MSLSFWLRKEQNELFHRLLSKVAIVLQPMLLGCSSVWKLKSQGEMPWPSKSES